MVGGSGRNVFGGLNLLSESILGNQEANVDAFRPLPELLLNRSGPRKKRNRILLCGERQYMLLGLSTPLPKWVPQDLFSK